MNYSFLPLLWMILGSISLFSCHSSQNHLLSIQKEDSLLYGEQSIDLFTLTNANGMTVKVTNYGASLVFATAPDRQGKYEPVILSLESLQDYVGRQPKMGATVGRFANRIQNAQFKIGDTVYTLDANSKGHCIHGGKKGFHTQVFQTDTCYTTSHAAAIVFSYVSCDGEGGFPGNLHLSLTYQLTNQNEIILDYKATTDQPTVVNLTNHSYFNLSGCRQNILNHWFQIVSDSITENYTNGIPTGKLLAVKNTDFDFRELRPGKASILQQKKGFDTNYQLKKEPHQLTLAAQAWDPESGRLLKAYTTEPGMQFYTPSTDLSYLNGYGQQSFGKYYGFCLEMQHYPDSPHQAHFPTTLLYPGEVYQQTTIYRFETLNK